MGIFGGKEWCLQTEGTPVTLSTSVTLMATAAESIGEREMSPMRIWLKGIWQTQD
jgi:hypothetical protein